MSDTFKVAYISLGTVDNYDKIHHVDAARWTELFLALTKTIPQVNKLDFSSIPKDNFRNFLIDFAKDKDFILLNNEALVKNFIKLSDESFLIDFLDNNKVLLLCDSLNWSWLDISFDNLCEHFKILAVASHSDYLSLSNSHNSDSVVHLPLACTDRKINALSLSSDYFAYVGRLQKFHRQKFINLLSKLKNIKFYCNLFLYQDQVFHLDGLDKNTLKINDSVPYSKLYSALNGAAGGLAFFSGGKHPNGKVWDYLSFGLPVVYEEGIDEESMIIENNFGISINNIEEFNAKNFQHIFNHIKTNHLWENRADFIKKILQNI
jgi:hypothetical protein